MSHYLTLAAVSFFSVFVLGFQSRNINTGEFGWAAACSILIGLSNAYVWRSVTMESAGWAEWLIYSVSGGFGITSAMWVHRKYVHKDTKN